MSGIPTDHPTSSILLLLSDLPVFLLALFSQLSDEFADDVAVDIGKAEVAAGVAIGEALVVEA